MKSNMNWFGRFVKRVFDILFAIILLSVLSPVYIITAIIIIISSPGNPIYCAKRVVKNGRIFTCYKFRSMHKNSGKVHLTTLRNDSRIFPFGRFIRKTKIDELPQAINILFGQMSVVGPRPEDKEIADQIYTDKYNRIMDVKPGLTSTASLYDFTHGEKYENEEEYEKEFLTQKLELEVYYVENQSVSYDLRLIFRTAKLIIQTVFGKESFDLPKELQYIQSVEEQEQSTEEVPV